MECVNEVFPVILYFLLSILLVVLIVLCVKVINTLTKVNKVVDDVNFKVNKLNGVFNIIDSTTDALSLASDKIVDFIVNGISNLFSKKNKNKEERNLENE